MAMRDRRTGWLLPRLSVLLVSVIPLFYGWIQAKEFLALDEDSLATDGYASQVAFIRTFVDSESNLLEVEPLYWLHGLRALIAFAFESVHSFGGPLATSAVMLCFVWPLFNLFDSAPRRVFALLLPLTLVMLSYRAVLVLASIGYLLLYIVRKRSKWFLVISFVFASLSSGAALSGLIISLALTRGYRCKTASMMVYVLGLAFSFGISVLDKYAGFVSGLAGYDATIEGATGVAAILSRSTIFVSSIQGDYLRSFVYLGLFAGVLLALVHASHSRRLGGYAVIFIATIPVFFFEGLGVVSVLVPVLMFLSGVSLPRRLEHWRNGTSALSCVVAGATSRPTLEWRS